MVKLSRHSGGYTIVEVSLFLAITASLFCVAAAGIGRQQRAAQFTDSTRQVESLIKDTLNDMLQGKYGQPIGGCRNNGASPIHYSFDATITPRGGCIFMGKVISFTNNSSYTIYTLAGQRNLTSGAPNTEPTDLASARIGVVDPLTVSGEMPWGMNIRSGLGSNNYTAMFGLVYVPTSTTVGTVTTVTYSLRAVNYAVDGSATENLRLTKIADINSYSATTAIPSKLCLDFPGYKTALLTVSATGTNMQVSSQLDGVSCT